MLMTSSCWNGGTFEKSTATPTMETEIVGVVGRLKTMEVPLHRQLLVNVGGGRGPPPKLVLIPLDAITSVRWFL